MTDPIDRRILAAVARDGRISIKDLAREISLSTSATSERLRRLEGCGAILGYRAEIDPAAVGRALDAVIGVRAHPDADRPRLESWLTAQPCVVEALHLTGPYDYLVRARCRNAEELDSVLMRMKRDAGAADTTTHVVLRALPTTPTID